MAPRVAIFWDIETCFLPEKLTGYETVDSIRRIANSYGSVTLFKLYTEGFEGHVSLPRDIRTQLELSGVSLVECTQEANSSLLSQLPTGWIPHDLAAVVPYRDGRRNIDSDPDNDLNDSDDVEGGDIKKTNTRSTNQDPEFESIVASDTPFFHVDLQAAVQAAESNVGRSPSSS